MTEEKENCIFQQNYNVFGLDDKPCCYLYHKYCDEIDNCYFKRCKRLEQECDELKKACEKCKLLDIEKTNRVLLERIAELEQENKELKEKVKELDKMTGIFFQHDFATNTALHWKK